MEHATAIQEDIEAELEELRTTVDELEATVETFERQLIESKLGGDSLLEVETQSRSIQPAAAD